MKNTILYLSLILSAFIYSSCEETPVPTESEKLVFTISVPDSTLNFDRAKVHVTHNGPADVTWYGFLTEDLRKNEYDLFMDTYTELVMSGNLSEKLNRTNNRSFHFENLKENKSYRFVVFGIKENGDLYDSNIATKNFTTAQNIYRLSKKDNVWNISYTRNIETNMENISITSTREVGYFYCNVFSEEDINEWNTSNPDGYKWWVNGVLMTTVTSGIEWNVLQTILEIQNMQAYYDIASLAKKNSGATPVLVEFDRLAKGRHYAVVVGFNKDGQHTQEYAVKEINITEDGVATQEYLNWCGTYDVTGKADIIVDDVIKEDQDVTYRITIAKDDNNFRYKITGWECGDDVQKQWGDLEKAAGIYAYFNKGNLEFRETRVTYVDIEGYDYRFRIGIYGHGYNETTYAEVPVLYEGTAMGVAQPIEDGKDTTTIEAQTFEYSYYDENGNIKTTSTPYTKIGMMAVSDYGYMSKNPALKFPLTLKKISE